MAPEVTPGLPLPERPSRYYKYYTLPPPGTDDRTYRSQLFLERKVYFPSHLQFNDPYDFYPRLTMKCTREQYISHVRRALAHRYPNLGAQEVDFWIRRSLRDHWPFSRTFQRQTVREYRAFLKSKVGILCLAERPDSLLMWGHYANRHTGFCVEFIPQGPDSVFHHAYPVSYSPRRITVNLMNDFPSVPRIISLTKAADWAYEREWRIVNGPEYGVDAPDLVRPFILQEGEISAVILGARMTAPDRRVVAGWAESMSSPPRVYEARISQVEYLMTISPRRRS